jgi:hypothetical protein
MIVLANRPGFPFLGNDFFGTLGKNNSDNNSSRRIGNAALFTTARMETTQISIQMGHKKKFCCVHTVE